MKYTSRFLEPKSSSSVDSRVNLLSIKQEKVQMKFCEEKEHICYKIEINTRSQITTEAQSLKITYNLKSLTKTGYFHFCNRHKWFLYQINVQIDPQTTEILSKI